MKVPTSTGAIAISLALVVSLTLFVSLPLAIGQPCTTGKCEFKNMNEAIDKLLAREATHDWQKISWRTSASKALQDAQAQSKPIFVFFIVKQKAPSPKSWVGPQNDMGKT